MPSAVSPASVGSLPVSAAVPADGTRRERLTEKDFDFPNPDALYLQQWSCVPVVCSIAECETLDGKPRRCQFIVPRQSFLYHYAYSSTLAGICNAARNSGCRWFSYRCLLYPKADIFLPLPIQYPIHVLCDLVTAERGGLHNSVPAFRAPLVIRIHFSEPKKEDFEVMCSQLSPMQAATLPTWEHYLLRYQSSLRLDSVRCPSKWMRHTVRQHMLLRFGSCSVLRNVERDMPEYGEDLLRAVVDNNPERYWRARSVVDQYIDMQSNDSTDVKFVIVLHLSPWQTKRVLWRGGSHKVGVFLRDHVEAFAQLERDQHHSTQPCQMVFVQGMNLLLSTPMDALIELLSSTDGVVHMVLKKPDLIKQFVGVAM
mmetsp:Transcript_40804/g.47464  ORF Transcript_40804/g.47464 Transcript_40804/m.47464 type:complete len:369 (+) Transcript_40804:56-1162(+)|eukprot:CAMPEP_0176426798 /NCGR_PEP_ID=MMETSP0127-20121128/12154_1 /TAXON_ID=938130 /ORGANISM="Platyophrya macrostoma, Strain WH" /LENGTH=368 /DNA_ID=CAMNT_0017808129 /DNA_START=48 /DNA_END=1154 /DNA_ORIENTATION=-